MRWFSRTDRTAVEWYAIHEYHGKHPKTDGYRWMENRSPKDLEIAEAPFAIIEKMMEQKKKTPQIQTLNSDTDKARSLLQSINPNRLDDYDVWVKIGMAAHSVGDNSLLHKIGNSYHRRTTNINAVNVKKVGII